MWQEGCSDEAFFENVNSVGERLHGRSSPSRRQDIRIGQARASAGSSRGSVVLAVW